MADELTREQAAAELARAGVAAGRVRRGARWASTYLTMFGIAFGAVTLLLGLVEPVALRITIFAVCWPIIVIAAVVWAHRQPAAPRGFGRTWGAWGWVGTGVLYGVALVVGTPAFEGRPAFWVPAAVIVALPLCVAGWRERRS